MSYAATVAEKTATGTEGYKHWVALIDTGGYSELRSTAAMKDGGQTIGRHKGLEERHTGSLRYALQEANRPQWTGHKNSSPGGTGDRMVWQYLLEGKLLFGKQLDAGIGHPRIVRDALVISNLG